MQYLQALRLKAGILAILLCLASFRVQGIESWPYFALVIMTVFVLVCAAMVWNDFCDRHNDVKKGKKLAFEHPVPFLFFSTIVWLFAAGAITFLNYVDLRAFWLAFSMMLVCLVYSWSRSVLFLPAAMVASTTACVVFFPTFGVQSPDMEKAWYMAAATFGLTTLRELLKDIEDAAVDRGYKSTLPGFLPMFQERSAVRQAIGMKKRLDAITVTALLAVILFV